MVRLVTIIQDVSIAFFIISILYMLFFFYKAARHPNKSYGLLMLFILVITHFVCSILQLIAILFPSNHPLLDPIGETLGKFAAIWILCLTICHYSILNSFKGKYKRFHYKTFIFGSFLVSAAFACITNFQFLKSRRIDFVMLYAFAIICLGYIIIKTKQFREEIQFGMYNFAKAPASKLIRFSSIQLLFAILYCVQDGLEFILSCPREFFVENQSLPCYGLDITWPVIYQSWIWFAVLFNWHMFSINKEPENKKDSEYLSNQSMTQTLSSGSLASYAEIVAPLAV